MTTTNKTFFGKLLAAIGGFFAHLFNGAKSAFDELPQDKQVALENGVNISELLKTGYGKGEDYIVSEVSTATGLEKPEATTLILSTFKDLGINATDVHDGLNQLADKIQAGITDTAYNNLWQLAAKSIATFLTGGSLDWVSLSMGLVEWAFQHFVASNK